MKYLGKIYFVIFISIILAITYIFISINGMQKDINNNVKNLFVNQAKEFGSSIDNLIHSKIKKDIYLELKSNFHLKNELEKNMEMLVTSSYKFIYVLYKDKKGNYRYLLDGSKIDKGEFNQKLDVDKKIWNSVYKTQKEKIINQTNFEMLWITYLKPVIFENKVQAIIAIDFSNKLPKQVSSAISPINKVFNYIFLAIFVILLILLYQTILSLRAKKDSITDALTQIYNRTFLRDFLKSIDTQKYQILMFDIDHFKKINDYYGHKAGDYILQQIAFIIKREIREEDVFIRYGGEEFLVFIKRENLQENIGYKIAQRLNKKIQNTKFIYDDKEIGVTISIGVNCKPHTFKNVHEAIKYADKMLYIAKGNGRNQVVKQPDRQMIDSQNLSISKIKDALENDEVICYYQPIFDTKTKIIKKYEALVRIKYKGEIIVPKLFLDNIMHTNMYNDITKRVLEIVFKNIKSNKKSISVNMNFSDIVDNTIYQIIKNEIIKNKDLAKYLTLELLENEKIQYIDIVKQRIKELKQFGIEIAIDDFGSGYSNYDIFKSLDIDILKIDGSIIQDLDNSDVSLTITESIVLLAKELNLTVVAEYVHNEDIYHIVSGFGIELAQGFYLSKPLEKI